MEDEGKGFHTISLIVRMEPGWDQYELDMAKKERSRQADYLRQNAPEFLAFLVEIKERFGGLDSVEYRRDKKGTAGCHDGHRADAAMQLVRPLQPVPG